MFPGTMSRSQLVISRQLSQAIETVVGSRKTHPAVRGMKTHLGSHPVTTQLSKWCLHVADLKCVPAGGICLDGGDDDSDVGTFSGRGCLSGASTVL